MKELKSMCVKGYLLCTWHILHSKYFDFKLNKRRYPCSKNPETCPRKLFQRSTKCRLNNILGAMTLVSQFNKILLIHCF